MKQVFSLKKFIEDLKPKVGDNILIDALKLWALECEGLTPEEMKELHYGCANEWLIEVED